MRRLVHHPALVAFRWVLGLAFVSMLVPPADAVAGTVLQIGALAGANDVGTWADYQSDLTSPDEEDTAVVYGDPFDIYVSGQLQSGGDNTLLSGLGGQVSGGLDWVDSSIGASSNFAGKGALLLASVDSGDASGLTVDGMSAFYTTTSIPSFLPNSFNHAPLKDGVTQQFLFFDIGDFTLLNQLVNYDSESDIGLGEQKQLTIAGTRDLGFIHFDVLALETDTRGNTKVKVSYDTDVVSNPKSKDVTWKQGVVPSADSAVPEPGSFAIFGFVTLGLAGAGIQRRRRRSSQES